MTREALQWGRVFSEKYPESIDIHMKPDPYLTLISIPEGMDNYMQGKNNTISIRHSWRMFL